MPKSSHQAGKIEKFNAVSLSLFAILSRVGASKITHAAVAKHSSVSRAWLYKYIGSEKEDLIRFAIEHLGRIVADRDKDDKVTNRDEFIDNVVVGMDRMFQNTSDYPWFIPVYFKYRGTQTAPGLVVNQIEQAYIAKQSNCFVNFFGYTPQRAIVAAEVLTSFRMGLAFAWQNGDLSNKAERDEVLNHVRSWMTDMLANSK